MYPSESKIPPTGFMIRISAWNASHPVLAIVLVALLAVAINCHPIIFCGKSYVAPMPSGEKLVYNWWPPLPGMERWSTPSVLECASPLALCRQKKAPLNIIAQLICVF